MSLIVFWDSSEAWQTKSSTISWGYYLNATTFSANFLISMKTGIVDLIPLLSTRNNWKEVPKNEKLGSKVTPSRTVPYDSRRSTLNVATTAACCVVRIVQDFTAHPSPPDKPLRPVPSALRRMWTRLYDPFYMRMFCMYAVFCML